MRAPVPMCSPMASPSSLSVNRWPSVHPHNDPVSVVIGLAVATPDAHVTSIAELANVFNNPETIPALARATSVASVLELLCKIVAICGAGLGTSAILKLTAERALERLGIDASVTASDVSSVAVSAADAQVILSSSELVDRIGDTNADVIVVDNYFDVDELEQKLEIALG